MGSGSGRSRSAVRKRVAEKLAIERVRKGKTFRYLRHGRPISEAETAKINDLAIPPAWKHVRIADSDRAAIRAVGRDSRGRQQYIYSGRWREKQDMLKFQRIAVFGKALPGIRRRLTRDLRGRRSSRVRATAAAVRLMELAPIRPGDSSYEKENGSFGLTTLRRRHCHVRGTEVGLRFIGKGGREHRIAVSDKPLARALVDMRRLPGDRVFQYLDPMEEVRPLKSSDIREYLSTESKARLTSKDFRTWTASVMTVSELAEVPPPETARARKQIQKHAECSVAERLGNTPAICRTSYIYPGIFAAWEAGRLQKLLKKNGGRWRQRTRPWSESLLIALLKSDMRGSAHRRRVRNGRADR